MGVIGGLRTFMRTGHRWNPTVRRVLAGPLHHHRLDNPVEDTTTEAAMTEPDTLGDQPLTATPEVETAPSGD